MNEHPMSIEIRRLEAEIERLKGEIRKLETLWFSENYRLKDLLTHAADALESWHPYLEFAPEDEVELVKELRKAAE